MSRDGSKHFNIRTCEHMILGQLMMGARQTKNAPLHVGLNIYTHGSGCRDGNTLQLY